MARKSLIGSFVGTTKPQDSLLLQKLNGSSAAKKSIKGNNVISLIEQIRVSVEKHLANHKQDVAYIREESLLESYITKCIKNGVIAIDTETTGLDCLRDSVVGSCLYTPGEKAVYIPHKHKSYITGQFLNNQISPEFMGSQYQRLLDNNVKIIMHNAKFDKRMIKSNFNVDLDVYWDTMLAAKILNNLDDATLKGLTAKYIDNTQKTYDFSKLFSSIEYAVVPVDVASLYAATDSLITYELYEYQVEQFKTREFAYNLFMNLEMKVLPIVCDMENSGVYLDVDYAKELSVKYHKKLDEALENLQQEFSKYKGEVSKYNAYHPNKPLPTNINWSSPQQLAILFYDILGFESVDKKSPRGTGEEVMKHYANKGITLCKAILDYRGISKLLSTYIDKMPEVMNPQTHRVHASFNQIGADCVVGDTIIPTLSGYYSIEELVSEYCQEDGVMYDRIGTVVDDRGCCKYYDGCIKFTNVPTIKITTKYGYTLQGTPNHPIICSPYDTKTYVNLSNRGNIFGEEYFCNLDSIREGQYVKIPLGWNVDSGVVFKSDFSYKKLKTHNSKEYKIPEYLDEQFSELLGMYHADGSYSTSNGSSIISISNCDEYVYKRVEELCESLFGRESTHYINKKIQKERDTYLNVTHVDGIDKFMISGARNKCIPEYIFRSKTSIINSYIRGMTLDSSFNKRDRSPEYVLHVMQEYDARFIQTHLASLGIVCSVNRETGKCCSGYRVGFNLYDFDKFRKIIGVIPKKIAGVDLNDYKNVHKSIKLRKDDCVYVYVKNIERNVSTVYDISVPDGHTFLGNSFICHNTGRFSSSDPKIRLGRRLAIA